MVAMRLEGTRTLYRAPIDSVFRAMAMWHATAEKARKRQGRKTTNSKL